MSLSEGSESLLKSLTCPSILQGVESSVTIMCESSEDMTSPSKINDLNFPSSNMSISILDLSIENQKGGYIKPDQIKLLKYTFPRVALLLSPSGTLSPLGSYCPSLPPHFPHFLCSGKCHRL